jgi:hypothetical protein
MGKLKNMLIVDEEQLDSRLLPKSLSKNPRVRGMEITDEELAQFDKEFNAWLDAYEASFGRDYL